LILLAQAASEQWPEVRQVVGYNVFWTLERLPYWLVFWVTLTTIISGYLYIQNHMDLLKKEFSILKKTPSRRPAK
jgi:hypothetical protein